MNDDEKGDQLARLLEEDQLAMDERKGRTWKWIALGVTFIMAGLSLVEIVLQFIAMQNSYGQLYDVMKPALFHNIFWAACRLLVCIIALPLLWKRKPLGWAFIAGFALLVLNAIYWEIINRFTPGGRQLLALNYFALIWLFRVLICVLMFLTPMRKAFSVRASHVYVAIGVMIIWWVLPGLLRIFPSF